MSTPAPGADANPFDALLAATSAAVDALVTWDVTAFEQAVERQRGICDGIALHPPAACRASAAQARQVRQLTRSYARLLRHSIHWAQTIRTILQAGQPLSGRPSMHLKG